MGEGNLSQKVSLPRKVPPPRNPDGFLRGLFAGIRFPATLNRKGGSLSRPPHPAVWPQAAKPLIGQNAPYTPPRFVNYKKIGERLYSDSSRSPSTLPTLLLKVLERWGPGGGNPFSNVFPPPQKPPPRNPHGFLRGLFAESRLSATLIPKSGSLSRPPRPTVLPQAAKPLVGQNAPYTPPRFVNYKK